MTFQDSSDRRFARLSKPLSSKFKTLLAMLAALFAASAFAFEPFTVKDIRVEGVQRTEAGKAHIYRATATQEDTQSQLLRDLSERLFSGSAAQLAMHALSMQPANADELQEIRDLIEKRSKQK